MKKVNVYEAADKAIMSLDREALKAFGKLKMAKFDEIQLIRTVQKLYREQEKKARDRYREIAFEAYILGLYLCGTEGKEAHRMAERDVTQDWLDELLEETNFVTLYRFTTEAERKAQRLAETLEAVSGGGGNYAGTGTDAVIDKAMRDWCRMAGQYAISVTDAALLLAYEAMDVNVMWVTQKDERVCTDCHRLDGKVFAIKDIPPKPHWGCRCLLMPTDREPDSETR